MMKSFIVVFLRSYGTSCTIEKRGPQLVQFVKAYLYLLLFLSFISRLQSSHIAKSGEISVSLSTALGLALIIKSISSPLNGKFFTSISETNEAGGAKSFIPFKNCSNCSPCASIKTPSLSFNT